MKRIFLVSSLLFPLLSLAQIKAYFNHSSDNKYTDPYRKTTRTGDNLEEVMIRQLSLAKKSVLIAVQEFRLPLLANKLVELKKSGVTVNIILENNYNKDLVELTQVPNTDDDVDNDSIQYDVEKYNDLFKLVDLNDDGQLSQSELLKRDAVYMLRHAGITIKDDTFDGSLGSALMHHKFIVIDNKTTIASSANFTLSGVHGDFTNSKSQGNANSLMIIEDESVSASFSEEFYIMWGKNRSESTFGVNKPYRGAKQFKLSDGTKLTLQFSPSPRNTLTRLTTNGLIAGHVAKAKKSVHAALFVFSEQKIADAMLRASKQGAQISVLVESRFANRYYSELLDLWGIQLRRTDTCEFEPDNNPWPARNASLVSGGVPKLTSGDLLHHKYAVVDSNKVIFGSHNWSESANYQNDEFLIIVEHKQVAQAYEQEFMQWHREAKLDASNALLERIDQANAYCEAFLF